MKAGSGAGSVLAVIGIAIAIAGCGGGEDSTSVTAATGTGASTKGAAASVPLPTAKALIACFRKAGATSVYQRNEDGVVVVDGLIEGGIGIVSVRLTGTRAKSEAAIEKLKKSGEIPGLRLFEALGGEVVGAIAVREPASKQIILDCLEQPVGGRSKDR